MSLPAPHTASYCVSALVRSPPRADVYIHLCMALALAMFAKHCDSSGRLPPHVDVSVATACLLSMCAITYAMHLCSVRKIKLHSNLALSTSQPCRRHVVATKTTAHGCPSGLVGCGMRCKAVHCSLARLSASISTHWSSETRATRQLLTSLRQSWCRCTGHWRDKC